MVVWPIRIGIRAGRVTPHCKRSADYVSCPPSETEGQKLGKGIVMKNALVGKLGVVAMVVAGAVMVVGCKPKSASKPLKTAGVAERTGGALDRAAEKTADVAVSVADKTVEVATNVADKAVDAAKATAATTKDIAGKVVEKTGKVLENAGDSLEQAGTSMQK